MSLENLDRCLTEARLRDLARDLYAGFKLSWKKLFPSIDDLINFVLMNEKYFNVVNPMLQNKDLHEADESKTLASKINALKPNAIIMAIIILLAKANGIHAMSAADLAKGIKIKGLDTAQITSAAKTQLGDFSKAMFKAFMTGVSDSTIIPDDKAKGGLTVDAQKIVDKAILGKK